MERKFFDDILQEMDAMKAEVDKPGAQVINPDYIERIAHLLSKAGVPFDYSSTGKTKSKMIREFMLAKRRIIKKLMIHNLQLTGLSQLLSTKENQ